MAIDKEELTEEQKKALVKLYRKFVGNSFLAALFYLGFAFFANFAAVLLDELYIHNHSAKSLLFIGTALISWVGFWNTFEEHRDELAEKAKKIVGHS